MIPPFLLSGRKLITLLRDPALIRGDGHTDINGVTRAVVPCRTLGHQYREDTGWVYRGRVYRERVLGMVLPPGIPPSLDPQELANSEAGS